MFRTDAPGTLVDISGTDLTYGDWAHRAFVPDPLPDEMPALGSATFLAVAEARASLAALDATSRRLPNPTLLRQPTLRPAGPRCPTVTPPACGAYGWSVAADQNQRRSTLRASRWSMPASR